MSLMLCDIPEEATESPRRRERISLAKDVQSEIGIGKLPIKKKTINWDRLPIKLSMEQKIVDDLVIVLKDTISKNINNRMGWDVTNCDCFDQFKSRCCNSSVEELKILGQILTSEEINNFINTFEDTFNIARIKNGRTNTADTSPF